MVQRCFLCVHTNNASCKSGHVHAEKLLCLSASIQYQKKEGSLYKCVYTVI